MRVYWKCACVTATAVISRFSPCRCSCPCGRNVDVLVAIDISLKARVTGDMPGGGATAAVFRNPRAMVRSTAFPGQVTDRQRAGSGRCEAWDDAVHPDSVEAWMAKLDADVSAGGLVPDSRFLPHGNDFRGLRVHQTRLRGRDASSDCQPTPTGNGLAATSIMPLISAVSAWPPGKIPEHSRTAPVQQKTRAAQSWMSSSPPTIRPTHRQAVVRCDLVAAPPQRAIFEANASCAEMGVRWTISAWIFRQRTRSRSRNSAAPLGQGANRW